MKNLSAIIEALLFIHGEPLSFSKLAKLTKKSENEIKESATFLTASLKDENSGLFLLENDDSLELSTKPEFSSFIEDLIKDDFESNLSPASLEALTIISYLAPISRAEIDYIRGVNSSFMLRSLLLRGLISRKPDPKRSYIYLYEPTFNLLKFLGISSVKDLPNYEKYHNLLKTYQEKENNEKEKKSKQDE